jgi:hypothetical protein
MVVLTSTGASCIHNCYIDAGTSTEYFEYHLVHFVTVFSFFQIISLSKTCWCFPSTDQSVEPNKNDADPKLIAVILQNPSSAKAYSIGDVQSRHFNGFLSWLQSLSTAVSQTAGDNITSGTTAAGNFLNSLLGGQSSYAYPFPYRR